MDADLLGLPKGEVLQSAGLLETGAFQPQFDAAMGPAIYLVAEDDL